MDLAAIISTASATVGGLAGMPFYANLDLNVTKVVGFTAYGIATLACGLRGRVEGGARGVKWVLLAAAFALLAIDLMLGLRHALSGSLADLFTQAGLRGSRRLIQVVVLGVLAVVGVGGLLLLNLLVFRYASVGFRIAATALALAAGVVAVEVLSLHQVDALLYRPIWGDLKAIVVLWAVSALTACIGAMLQPPEGRPNIKIAQMTRNGH